MVEKLVLLTEVASLTLSSELPAQRVSTSITESPIDTPPQPDCSKASTSTPAREVPPSQPLIGQSSQLEVLSLLEEWEEPEVVLKSSSVSRSVLTED